MEILTLWPLAQAEIEGNDASWVDRLFYDHLEIPQISPIPRVEVIDRVVVGGYPEPRSRTSEPRRRAWFNSYLTTILQRDVRELANIESLTEMPRLMFLLASRIGGLLNVADISRTIGIANTTLHRYMSLLQSTYLVYPIPAWSANVGLRLVKSPKLYLTDSGLAAHLTGLTTERLAGEPILLGPIFENFVAMEAVKAIGVSDLALNLYHYRTSAGSEVDLLIESADGRLVGIEVKASSTVTASDFRGLRALADAVGERFVRGVVVYCGDNVVPFGENLHAVPVGMLWA